MARVSARGSTGPDTATSKADMCFLHGTLFVYIRSASDLGRSAAAEGADCGKNDLACKLGHGARFVGKKMLNAVRATNNVRVLELDVRLPCCVHASVHCCAQRERDQRALDPFVRAGLNGRSDETGSAYARCEPYNHRAAACRGLRAADVAPVRLRNCVSIPCPDLCPLRSSHTGPRLPPPPETSST